MEAGLCLVALLVIWVSHFIYRWSNPNCNGKLPPGAMGLPLIGDTFEFLASHSLYEISPFISKRIARYGPLFRVGLFGQKMVVSTDPETNYSIFRQENQDLVLWHFGTIEEMVGEKLLASHGSIHRYMKNLVLRMVGSESLRVKLLHEMDVATQRHLRSWATDGRVHVIDASQKMLLELVAGKLLSYDESKQAKKLGENYKTFKDGLVSLPLNIPGTTFHASIQAQKRAMKTIEEIYLERKASKIPMNDFLDHIVEEAKKEDTFLNDTNVVKLLFSLLLAGYDSTSQAVTLVTKFISEHPNVLVELTKEHETILKNRGSSKNSDITWEEYKSMTFTHMVINETIRLSNMVPGIFRKVLKDMQINGYTIPKGWIIMAALPVVHLSADKYENPFVFNPWRWQGKELNAGSKTFMGFGIGVRLCVGAEFTKVQMAVYLHHLVTKYSWSVYKGGEIIRRPVNIFPNGIHIKIEEKYK
ncbi:hypothetical protein Dsin_026192 [Dipteronia sinensis]|uniref:Cytochrome P450 n=1 Tax=Dipteronia sinensis TaxID=43782 RepID=A0AAE0DXN0_9ROSI|nr:hypothetical protein Dsin_026192 [Dipteronia sinensis]